MQDSGYYQGTEYNLGSMSPTNGNSSSKPLASLDTELTELTELTSVRTVNDGNQLLKYNNSMDRFKNNLATTSVSSPTETINFSENEPNKLTLLGNEGLEGPPAKKQKLGCMRATTLSSKNKSGDGAEDNHYTSADGSVMPKIQYTTNVFE